MEKSRELIFSYDRSADVFYMSIGKPKSGIDEDAGEGIYMRKDKSTDEIQGLMIIDFLKRFRNESEYIPVRAKNLTLVKIRK